MIMLARRSLIAVGLALSTAVLVGCGSGPQSANNPGPTPQDMESQPAPPKGSVAVPAQPSVQKEVALNDSAKLTGYSLQKGADGKVTLYLYWQCLRAMPADYTVFVHLFPASRDVLTADRKKSGYANLDNKPKVPTSKWEAGKTYTSIHRAALNPASYKTAIGMYALEDGKAVRVRPSTAKTAEVPEKDAITVGPLSTP